MHTLIFVAIVALVHGCASENDLIEGLKAQHEAEVHDNKSLPVSFVECPNNFYWSTRKFSGESREYDHVIAENAAVGPLKFGFGTVKVKNYPSKSDVNTCQDISRKIRGGLTAMAYTVNQQFDADAIFSLIQADSEFQSVLPLVAYLENTSYYLDSNNNKIENYNLSIPVSVTCEDSWMVKKYATYPFRVFFQQPKGRCYFSTQHYELAFSPQEKIIVALNGSYYIDSDYPEKVMIVEIENFGFLPR